MIATLAELKAHLNITGTDDDALLTDKLTTAHDIVANAIGYALDAIPDANGVAYSPAPAPVKEAVLKYAAHLYEWREPVALDDARPAPPLDIFDLVAPYRVWSF